MKFVLQLKDGLRSAFHPAGEVTQVVDVNLIDDVLLTISNSSLPTSVKSVIMGKIAGISDARLMARMKANLVDGKIIRSIPLPVNATYILNPEDTIQREEGLRAIKKELKDKASAVAAKYTAGQRDGIQRAHIPGLKDGASAQELIDLMSGESVDAFSADKALVQLLRIYREYVNLQIADVKADANVARAQLQIFGRGAEVGNRLRLGNIYSDQEDRSKPGIREIYGRLDRFVNAPIVGEVPFDKQGVRKFALNADIIYGIMTGDVTKESESIPVSLDADTSLKIDEIKTHLSERVNAAQAEPLAKNFLDVLGLLAEESVSKMQIENFMNGKPPVDTPFFSVYVKPGQKGLSIDPKYKIVIIPPGYNSELSRVVAVLFAHEFAHNMQQFARESSLIPGLGRLGGLGRSSSLAEAGALKMQKTVEQLFGIGGAKDQVSTYHYEGLQTFMGGGNFWDVINTVLKHHKIAGGDFDWENTYRRSMRIYRNYGATGDSTEARKYPTTTDLLSYIWQGFPRTLLRNASLSFFTSGVPAHQLTALQPLLTTPRIQGLSTNPTEEEIATYFITKLVDLVHERFVRENES